MSGLHDQLAVYRKAAQWLRRNPGTIPAERNLDWHYQEGHLTPWELSFLLNLSVQRYPRTERQRIRCKTLLLEILARVESRIAQLAVDDE